MKITLDMWTTAELATAKFTRLIPHCTSPKKIMFTTKSVPWGNGRLDKVIDKPYYQMIVCLVSGLYVLSKQNITATETSTSTTSVS